MATIPEEPQTNLEQYLNRIATGDGEYPAKPRTNVEQYLDYIIENRGGGGEAKVVDELPEEGETGYIYLILKESTKEGDIYDEYIWALQQDGETYGWEHLGATNEVTIKLYDATGQNTDGAMTQKAATDVFNTKADKSTTYTKTEVDEAVAAEATVRANADNALETAINAKLATKANSADLATVATSGSYNDLTNTPTIPTVNDATLTITQNGTSVGTFTANDADNTTIALTDTTYSNFTGTDGTTAGTNGLVPAPATTDADKFLKSDGTWSDAGGTLYTGLGQNTDGAMTQKATMDMVYTQTDKSRIRIGATTSSPRASSILIGYGKDETIAGWATVITSNPNGGTVKTFAGGTLIDGSKVSIQYGIAIGIGSIAGPKSGQDYDSGSTAIGPNSWAEKKGSVAIGNYSSANTVGEMNIGSTDTSYGYNSSNYRLLSGVYDPQSAHDAATKGYVDTAIAGAGAATINSTDWSNLWQ